MSSPRSRVRRRSQRAARRHDSSLGCTGIETLEPRRLLAGFVISEFLASNDNGMRDGDRNRPDWIEILNTNDDDAGLDGWFLTDDADDLDKWQFPDVRLGANERMVVFASEKNRRDPLGELHTNFRLGIEGEYLALVEPDGLTVAFDFGPSYPPQQPDVSFGIPQQVESRTVFSVGDTTKMLVPTTANGGDTLGTTWTVPGFDDSSWTDATTGLGYERRDGYGEFISTDVEASMFGVNSSVYLRMPFALDDPNSIYSLSLEMQYDDGYVAYVNGTEIVRRNAPEELTWNSAATDAHKDSEAIKPEGVTVEVGDFPGLLQAGENVLAIHALNDEVESSDFLMVPTSFSFVEFGALRTTDRHFFTAPSPGAPNGVASATSIMQVTHDPIVPTVDEPLSVTAKVVSTDGNVNVVLLHYRVMFNDELSVPMFDDGLHGDGAADDGEYGATIDAGLATPAEMIRYRITAESGTRLTQLPAFTDPLNTEQYFGTVVHDPSIQSNLRVIHLFMEDPDSSETAAGTQGSLFHDGKFYDNVRVDTTGRTVGLAGPKKSHDVFFTSDHWFELEDLQLRMNDFDIISDFWNRAKVRIPLAFETFRNIGTPAHFSMPVRVQRNGEFFATYSFVDGGNEQFLTRAGLNPTGALYKMNLGFSTGRGQSKKQTRTHENTDDLRAFFNGLKLTDEALTQFLTDNINIPAVVNFLVGLVAVAHGDCCGKNLYLYRDTEGTGEWETLPWDLDSAFGRGGVGRAQDIFPSAAGVFAGRGNPLFDALFDHVPGFREMYLRRLRTVLDDVLQPPGTPAEELKFERRIDEMVAQMEPDALLDFEKWGTWQTDPVTEKITYGKDLPNWQDHINILKNDYFPVRRELIYNQLRQANRGDVLQPQVGAPSILFGQIEFNPDSGNQDEEYISLTNPNDVAVDISGWQLTAGVQHTFRPGTVIPSGGTLYVSPNVTAFRARATGPSGGQSLFLQGNYEGHISNHGATIQLVALDQTVVAEVNTEVDLSAPQEFLRISEIMYHPADARTDDRFEDDDYEFIELVNISPTETISLRHVRLSQGVEFEFPALDLGPNERVVVVRDEQAFVSRYGTGVRIVGQYGRTARDFRLGNAGEMVLLEIADGDPIQAFNYDDAWHRGTDGGGFSLTVADVNADPSDWNTAEGWRPSQFQNGSPGNAGAMRGDFDGNGRVDVSDVDQFCMGLREGDLRFDLNADGVIDVSDLDALISGIMGTSYGDADLDGDFDASDLVQVFRAGEYENEIAGDSTWGEGDWNCDGEFNSADLVAAFRVVRFLAARPAEVAAVDRALSGVAGATVGAESNRHVDESDGVDPHVAAHSEPLKQTPLRLMDEWVRDELFASGSARGLSRDDTGESGSAGRKRNQPGDPIM